MSSPTSSLRDSFAANLKAALRGRRLSCAEVARRLDTNERVVRRWRNGETHPRTETVTELAYLLGLPEGWFYVARDDRELADLAAGRVPAGEPA